jgi:hypothetical protein
MIELAIKNTAKILPTRKEPARYDGFIYGLEFLYKWPSGEVEYEAENFYSTEALRDAAIAAINN